MWFSFRKCLETILYYEENWADSLIVSFSLNLFSPSFVYVYVHSLSLIFICCKWICQAIANKLSDLKPQIWVRCWIFVAYKIQYTHISGLQYVDEGKIGMCVCVCASVSCQFESEAFILSTASIFLFMLLPKDTYTQSLQTIYRKICATQKQIKRK